MKAPIAMSGQKDLSIRLNVCRFPVLTKKSSFALCLSTVFLLLQLQRAEAQMNPAITNFTDKGLVAEMICGGGTPPLMLQKKLNLSDANWVNVLTTSNRSILIPKDAPNRYFRMQSQVTNTVLAFTVLMNGPSEVPAVSTPASAIGSLSLEGSNLSFYVSFSGLSGPATLAHFHAPATPTNTAGVYIGLTPPSATAGVLSGTLVLTQDQITNFVNGLIYMNIHTALHPSGEIRGQVVPLHTFAMLNGAAEVPPVTTTGTAIGSLTFIGSQLFYDITYTNLSANATLAHIHGPATTANSAGVLVPLPSPSGTSGNISGSVLLTPLEMAYILAGQTYINIHTTANTSGEIRGQIWPMQVGATMDGPSEVPPIVTAGTGSALMNIVSNKLTYTVTFTNLSSSAILGHIHGPAPPTSSAGVLIGFSGVPSATAGTFTGSAVLSSQQLFYILTGQTYVNIHTANNGGGEIRGQLYPGN